MHRLDLNLSFQETKHVNRVLKWIIIVLAILLGLSCLAGFIVTSIHWNVSSTLVNKCQGQNDTQADVLCFIRSIIREAFDTQWNRFIMISLLFTYAGVFLHIIAESSRTNISGFLGLMVIQTMSICVGIGVAFPIVFLVSYVYFYASRSNANKSPVPIDILCIALLYIICTIIAPTYVIYFWPNHDLVVAIMTIILLVSPLGFALISLPFRFLSASIQRCWIINSHQLMIYCQVILFIVSAPLFFIALIAVIDYWSFELIKKSYISESHQVNAIAIIWSIDYASLFIGLVLYITTNEYFLYGNTHRNQSSKIKRCIGYLIFPIIFVMTPCLVFPLYNAWKAHQCLKHVF